MNIQERWIEAHNIASVVTKHFEGCHLTSYILPGETWATIGWGKAIPLSQHPKTITQAEADQLFQDTLSAKSQRLRHEIPAVVLAGLSAECLAALLSFRYNMKDQVWLNPKCNTRLALVRGDMKQFWIWHGKWINGEKGPLPGLKRRRRVENELGNGKTLDQIKKANWYQGKY